MRENYVHDISEILSANESQKNKIQFLERQRLKRDHYLSDLQENLSLNKSTLKQYNILGCNDKTIDRLIFEASCLTAKIKEYYDEYQNINASLLMQQQMRLQDKQFYQQRMIQFQNKMVDLRKYLHDKEQSFTSVVQRLKKYEEASQPTIDEKLHAYKKQLGQKYTNQFISQLIKQKNYYKNQFEKIKKQYYIFNQIKNIIINKYQEISQILLKYQKENQIKINQFIHGIYQKQEDKKYIKKIDPNKQLIRLLKKQKLNNQLLQEALNQAIQKNQQLITIKDIFQKNIQKLQNKCRLLYSQNTIFSLRLAQYDHHYCRKYAHNKKYYQQGEKQGLALITQERLKQYGRNIMQYYETNAKLYQKFNKKLQQDVNKWSQFICDSHQIKRANDRQKILMKSSSVPRLIVGFELDQIENQKLIIEQF